MMGAIVATVVVLPAAVWIWTSKPAQLMTKSVTKYAPIRCDTHTPGAKKALQAAPLGSQENPFVERCQEFGSTIKRCSDSSHVPVTHAVPRTCVHSVAHGGLCTGTETAHKEIQETSPCRHKSGSSAGFNQLEEAGSDAKHASPSAVLASHGVRRYRLNPDVQRAIPKAQQRPFLASTASLPLPRFGAQASPSGQTPRFS